MTEQEIIEGNTLIEAFMYDKPNYPVELLEYHLEYGWLMPVIEKIVVSRYNELKINGSQITLKTFDSKFSNHRHIHRELSGGLKSSIVELLWQIAVEYIKWYNKQNHEAIN